MTCLRILTILLQDPAVPLGEAVEEFVKRMEDAQTLLCALAPGDRRRLETLFATRRTQLLTKENVLANILDYQPGSSSKMNPLHLLQRSKVLS